MKGHPDVLAQLGELLTADLTAADLYLLFSRTMTRQGYHRLATHLQHESEHEGQHVQMLVQRILLLEGTPDMMGRLSVKPVPTDAHGILKASLDYELEVAQKLNHAIRVCEQHGDFGTRRLLVQLLKDTEEDHIDWLESQLHLIAEIGIAHYLGQHL